MASQNPLSNPGGWNKDTPAAEENNPIDSKDIKDTKDKAVPRTAVGAVGSSGEILTEGGSAIGKLKDSDDLKSLEGKAVTETGDIVDDSGDVLGKADIDQEASEYTTEGGQNSEKSGKSGGWNVLGKTKGAFSSIGGGFGGGSKSQADPADATNATEGVTDKAGDVAEGAKDTAEGAVEDTKETAEDAVEGTKDTAEDATKGAEDATEDAKDTAEDTTKGAEDATDDATKETPLDENGEPIQLDDKEAPDTEGVKDDAEGVKEDAEGAKDQVDENTEKPEGEELPEGEDKLAEGEAKLPEGEVPEGEVPEGEDKVAEGEEKLAEGEEKVPEGEEKPADGEEALAEGEKFAEGETPAEGENAEGETAEGEEKPAEGEEGEESAPIDYSVLKGTKVNKAGNLVNDNGDLIGRIVDGDVKKLVGKKADENGQIWNDSGKVVGQAEPIPDNEREDKTDLKPFENFPDATVEGDGRVLSDGKQVGQVVEGDPKKLKGSKVDEDGDILDRNGNSIGKAEAWDEPEPVEEEPEAEVDRSALAGKRVNKAGNVVDSNGQIFGKLIEGNASSLQGRMCDKEGNVRSESGDIIGKAELVPEGEREGAKEGPFAELVGSTVAKDGKVVTPSGDVVGRLTEGDPKVLFGRAVDEDGDILDKNGNKIGKAERWEEPEEEKKKGPLAGLKVNKEGNVLDDGGNIVAKLISGDIPVCAGKEIDDDNDVVNSKGQTVGHVSKLEDIPPEPETESAEEKEAREKAEKEKELAENDNKLAGKLGGAIEQSLEKIQPICKMITDKVDKAERTPKEELDEEQLVKDVKPLIEEAGKILTETNGMIRGMDPDGRIQKQAKHKSGTKDASPEEHHLAEKLKDLTGDVTQCVDNAKRKIDGMPHAKKELNPLWGLLTAPLGQILAAVGLLLTGVLGLVGQLLSGLGLGGLVNGLLDGLGLNKILGSLGLGSLTGALTGKK